MLKNALLKLTCKGYSSIMPSRIGLASRLKFTPREKTVIREVAKGKSNRQIAGVFNTTEQVIKNYLRVIFDKTGMGTRLELAIWALDHPRQVR